MLALRVEPVTELRWNVKLASTVLRDRALRLRQTTGEQWVKIRFSLRSAPDSAVFDAARSGTEV